MALRRLGICEPLFGLSRGLYTSLHTTIYHMGCFLGRLAVASGVERGYPSSGSVFALFADPLVQAILACTMLSEASFNTFADDMATISFHLGRRLREILEPFRKRRLATGSPW